MRLGHFDREVHVLVVVGEIEGGLPTLGLAVAVEESGKACSARPFRFRNVPVDGGRDLALLSFELDGPERTGLALLLLWLLCLEAFHILPQGRHGCNDERKEREVLHRVMAKVNRASEAIRRTAAILPATPSNQESKPNTPHRPFLHPENCRRFESTKRLVRRCGFVPRLWTEPDPRTGARPLPAQRAAMR